MDVYTAADDEAAAARLLTKVEDLVQPALLLQPAVR
jgi:hypothetical protein